MHGGMRMSTRKIPVLNGDDTTRIRILDSATALFAVKGFDAVSISEIAKIAGVQAPALYNHYESKAALFAEVLSRFEEEYRAYHNWLLYANENAKSLEEVLDNMFNNEWLEALNPITCLGMSMVLKGQHENEYASKSAFQYIYVESIRNIQASFDRLIEKNIIPPSDTKTIATLLLFCVISGNDISIHKFTDRKIPMSIAGLYDGLKKLITVALTQGLLQIDK
jgi:AcrR family transcriptional regulator